MIFMQCTLYSGYKMCCAMNEDFGSVVMVTFLPWFLGKGQAEREIMTEFLREARIDASVHVSTQNFHVSLTNVCGGGVG